MVQISIFLDLLPLKLCGKDGHAQRPDMLCGRGNPVTNNQTRSLTMCTHAICVPANYLKDNLPLNTCQIYVKPHRIDTHTMILE